MGWIGSIESPSADGRFRVQPYRTLAEGIESGGEPVKLTGPTKRKGRPLVVLEDHWLWAASRERGSNAPAVVRVDLCHEDDTRVAAFSPPPSSESKFPAAIAVHAQTCFAGWNGEVHAIRFEDAGPRRTVLACPGCPSWKPFDIICACPPLVLAVDDIVYPKWRMCIDATDPASPSVVYGHKFEQEEAYAEYESATTCNGRVLLFSRYANMGGAGETLELLEVGRRGIRHVAELNLHVGPRGNTERGYLQETRFKKDAIFNDIGEPQWREAGDRWGMAGASESNTVLDESVPYTRWSGFASVGGQLFVAAGPRGLLRFEVGERGFTRLSRALIGQCLDVVACGDGDIAALVGTERGRRILLLRPDPTEGLRGMAEVEVDEKVRWVVGQTR